MNYPMNDENRTWVEETAEKLHKKMVYGVKKAQEIYGIPYTTAEGKWVNFDITWWTNGFWPASMWQMYLATKDECFRAEAIRAEKLLDEALNSYSTLDHDVGFMWLIHSGVHYALEHNEDSYERTMKAAQHLACRFNPNGFIRAWNSPDRIGWAIIDCMMNLPVLYWASEQTGDPRFKLIAMKHADMAMEAFIRPDGSSHHIVVFDPESGVIEDYPGGQGIASGSSWSRGQAWALYGFTLSHILSGKQAYLDTAKRVANYFISQITDDYIPRCDFRQPAEPDLKDCAAGAIAAAGLLVLSRQGPECEAAAYRNAAIRILRAMDAACADWSEAQPAILTKCTSAYHDLKGHHITMDYADYFFIEAVNMLRGQELLFWQPK